MSLFSSSGNKYTEIMEFQLNFLILTLLSVLSLCSRRKHLFSHEKLKLFLKQHCEQQDGIIKIKVTGIVELFVGKRKQKWVMLLSIAEMLLQRWF